MVSRHCAATLDKGSFQEQEGATLWRSWLRHCATSRKIVVSSPDEVIVFFNWRNPSSRTVALPLTQRLTEMSTKNFLGGKRVADA
jgi:hypothetical protein